MSFPQLILVIFTFNMLAFGNGSALFALLQHKFVQDAGILNLDQFLYAYALGRVTPGQNNLYLVHPNGTGLHRITRAPAHVHQWGSFSFSPDGAMITVAFNAGEGIAPDIWVLNIDGSGLSDGNIHLPENIPIGNIVDTRSVEYGSASVARVRLAANFGALDEVWVRFP